MALSCPSCAHAIAEDELPRLGDVARVLCPQCQNPLTLPEMTVPLSLADAAAVRQASEGLDPSKKYALLVLKGPEAGRVVDVDRSVMTIGRSGCDILLDDAEISRRHAKIQIDGSIATVEDLDSTNGTFVDNERVRTASIENREKFRVGSHEIAFVVTDRD